MAGGAWGGLWSCSGRSLLAGRWVDRVLGAAVAWSGRGGHGRRLRRAALAPLGDCALLQTVGLQHLSCLLASEALGCLGLRGAGRAGCPRGTGPDRCSVPLLGPAGGSLRSPGPGQRDGPARQRHRRHRHPGLPRRPPQPLAAPRRREHQPPDPRVPPQGHHPHHHHRHQVQAVQDRLNRRPRLVLNGRDPAEKLNDIINGANTTRPHRTNYEAE